MRFHTKSAKYTTHSPLKKVLDKLGDGFLKAHRSFVVNLSEVDKVDENLVIIGENVIPVSKAHRKALREQLNLL